LLPPLLVGGCRVTRPIGASGAAGWLCHVAAARSRRRQRRWASVAVGGWRRAHRQCRRQPLAVVPKPRMTAIGVAFLATVGS